MNNNSNELKVEIKVDEKIASGVFSNFTNVSHSPEEYVFDFLFINPTPAPGFGKLVSRVVMTPGHAKRLLMVLSENIANYEKNFGEIKINKTPNNKITLQ